MIYTIYDAVGNILRNVTAPSTQIDIQLRSGENYIEGNYDMLLYYISGSPALAVSKTVATIVFDKLTITGNGIDIATGSGIPNPSTVNIRTRNVDGTPKITTTSVTDGSLELTSQAKGEAIVIINSGVTFTEQQFTMSII